MGYYIRVLTISDDVFPASELARALSSAGVDAALRVADGQDESWSRAELVHLSPGAPGDGVIAVIERNPVEPGSLGECELQEFLEEVDGRKPASAATWLKQYLPGVRVIYCIQIIHKGAEWNKGWDAIHAVQAEIRWIAGGIFQADLEGFTNDDGYHILWQFSDTVSGPWKMAVLGSGGKWIPFEMDLGNRAHREAFWQGRVPPGAKRL